MAGNAGDEAVGAGDALGLEELGHTGENDAVRRYRMLTVAASGLNQITVPPAQGSDGAGLRLFPGSAVAAEKREKASIALGGGPG